MIKIVDLQKKVGTNRIILNDFNIQIRRGEMVFVKGESGCGKTTLLKILALIDTYDSGQYIYEGKLIRCTMDRVKSKIRKYDIGYIPQNLNLIHDISAYENILLSLRLQKNLYNARKNIYEIAEYLEIKDVLNTTTELLSRGEQQRVAIARACVKKSKIIIADEPTASLDKEKSDKVIELFKYMNTLGNTIVLTSHDGVNERAFYQSGGTDIQQINLS